MLLRFLLIFFSALIFISLPGSVPASSEESKVKQCQSCHAKKKERFEKVRSWLKSRHAASGVTCADCHVGKETASYYSAVIAKTSEEAHSFTRKNPGSKEKRADFIKFTPLIF